MAVAYFRYVYTSGATYIYSAPIVLVPPSPLKSMPICRLILNQNAPRPPPPRHECKSVTPPPYYIPGIGWVGVSWQQHCKTCRSLHELDRQGTELGGFWRSITAGDRVRSFVRGGELLLHTRGMIVSPRVYGTAPSRQLHSTPPLPSLEAAIPEINLSR